MAASVTYWTNKGKLDLATVATASADLRALLVTARPASAAVAADYNFVSDISANEATATNYARHSLTNVTINEDDTNDRAYLDCDDIAYGSIGGAANSAVVGVWVYRRITNDSDSRLWCYCDLDDGAGNAQTITTNGGSFTVNINAGGWARIT